MDHVLGGAAGGHEILLRFKPTKSVVEWSSADLRDNDWIQYGALASSAAKAH